jgi:hypothetical protein
MAAWGAINQGEPNPLVDLICRDEVFQEYLKEEQMMDLMEAGNYVGFAPERASRLAQDIRSRFPLEKRMEMNKPIQED